MLTRECAAGGEMRRLVDCEESRLDWYCARAAERIDERGRARGRVGPPARMQHARCHVLLERHLAAADAPTAVKQWDAAARTARTRDSKVGLSEAWREQAVEVECTRSILQTQLDNIIDDEHLEALGALRVQ